jgi:hypothetical protein
LLVFSPTKSAAKIDMAVSSQLVSMDSIFISLFNYILSGKYSRRRVNSTIIVYVKYFGISGPKQSRTKDIVIPSIA